MTQVDVPTGHRRGSLGDVPDPLGGDGVPLFSVDDSGSPLLNSQRLLSCFQFCLWTPGGLFLLSLCLSVWLSVLFVLIYQHLTDPGTMGQRQSSPTPLSLMTILKRSKRVPVTSVLKLRKINYFLQHRMAVFPYGLAFGRHV